MAFPTTSLFEQSKERREQESFAETFRSASNGRQLDEKQLIGVSPAFSNVMHEIRVIASSDATVLITGETGTGKEMCARAIHYSSLRSRAPFIPVACGATPDELFENMLFGHERGSYTDARTQSVGLIHEAEGGTLFLDDVECLSPRNQAKLLRFLETHSFLPIGAHKEQFADIRVLSATNENLLARVQEKSYRDDLYFRLAVLTLSLPPLRTRAEDILLLADAFLRRFAMQYEKPAKRFATQVGARLLAYQWPGNIRELENTIHRAVIHTTTETIEVIDIAAGASSPSLHPTHSSSFDSFKQRKHELIAQFERDYVQQLLAVCNGNISEASRRAGKDRRAFWELMRKHGISSHSWTNDS